MKTITFEKGTKVQISDESYRNLQKAVQEEDVLIYRKGNLIYYPSPDGRLHPVTIDKGDGEEIKDFHYLTKDIAEKVIAFGKLLNYMERVNDWFDGEIWVIEGNMSVDWIRTPTSYFHPIKFSSRRIAERALKEHRELFKILYK